MRLRLLISVLALLAGVAVAHASSTFAEAAERLDGEWRGGDFVLRVDAKRAQASVDSERPFAWERFLVREVTPTEVVFAVGDELYEARLESDSLTLTGTSFRGERLLFRSQKESPVILELRR